MHDTPWRFIILSDWIVVVIAGPVSKNKK